jgi:hypothetical protein
LLRLLRPSRLLRSRRLFLLRCRRNPPRPRQLRFQPDLLFLARRQRDLLRRARSRRGLARRLRLRRGLLLRAKRLLVRRGQERRHRRRSADQIHCRRGRRRRQLRRFQRDHEFIRLLRVLRLAARLLRLDPAL